VAEEEAPAAAAAAAVAAAAAAAAGLAALAVAAASEEAPAAETVAEAAAAHATAPAAAAAVAGGAEGAEAVGPPPGADAAAAPAPAPEVPEVPEVPEAQEAPEAPEATEAPDAPEAPEAPDAPEAPEAPEAPAPVPAPAALMPTTPKAPVAKAPAAVAAPAKAAAAAAAEGAAPPGEAVEDSIDDIVPLVSYEDSDEKRSFFSKDGRWIIPKREQFPSVFCALRVRVRMEMLDPSRSAKELPKEVVEDVLRVGFGLGKSLVRWDDARDTTLAALISASTREVVVAINGALTAGVGRGSKLKDDRNGLSATVTEVTETSDDVDPSRIMSIASCLKESGQSDAIVFELPQLWIIPDPDFKPKFASIGLYPGSFWMHFLKSWGAIVTCEVYFRTAPKNASDPRVNLVVKFRDRKSMKMCFTFLYDRYLVHPKQENELRPPWCRLTSFQDFKSKATAKSGSGPKAKAKAGITKARPAAKALSVAGLGALALQPAPIQAPAAATASSAARPVAAAAPAKAGSPAAAKAAAAAKARAPEASPKAPPQQLAPMTPMPAVGSVKRPRPVGDAPLTPLSEAARAAATATGAAPKAKSPQPAPAAAAGGGGGGAASEDPDRKLTPAEAMSGLSGKHLEAFQMVMSRMERLERENQELMQILLQMQGLLQQQQQRNARLSQMAGFSASGNDQALGVAAAAAASARAGPPLGTPTSPGAPHPMAQMPPTLQRLPLVPPLGGIAGLPAQPAPGAGGVRSRIGQLARGEAAAQKRKAGAGPDGAVGEEQHYAAAAQGEGVDSAPWKSQRKRQRRAPREGPDGGGATAAGAAPVGAASAGLAAYHNALLG